MTSDRPTTSQTPADRSPTDLTRVAQQIRRRTTDLLGIGIVTIGCLAVARYVSDAWRTDTPPATPPVHATGWDQAAGTILQFGSMQQALHRQTVHGSHDEALTQLAENCRTAAASTRHAITSGHPPDILSQDISPEEQRLLELLQTRTADEILPDGTQLHRINGLLPMVVAIGDPAAGNTQSPPSTATASLRVLSWGIAVPADQQQWSLMTLHPAAARHSDDPGTASVPLPADSHRTLDITGSDGGRLVCFRGSGPARQWVRELDRQFLHRQWQPQREWSRGHHGGWSATYIHDDDSGPTRADLQLAPQPDGEWVGILQIAPRHN